MAKKLAPSPHELDPEVALNPRYLPRKPEELLKHIVEYLIRNIDNKLCTLAKLEANSGACSFHIVIHTPTVHCTVRSGSGNGGSFLAKFEYLITDPVNGVICKQLQVWTDVRPTGNRIANAFMLSFNDNDPTGSYHNFNWDHYIGTITVYQTYGCRKDAGYRTISVQDTGIRPKQTKELS